jgi:hypothetical protein
MTPEELKVKIGDHVVISRPRPNRVLGARIEGISTVTAVRPKSFDAGGLCFRTDGREWGGHNRVRLLTPEEQGPFDGSLTNDPKAPDPENAGRKGEDAILAVLLSSRDEKDWLKLGIHELRRIAALHGISSQRMKTSPAPKRNDQK